MIAGNELGTYLIDEAEARLLMATLAAYIGHARRHGEPSAERYLLADKLFHEMHTLLDPKVGDNRGH